MCLECTQRVSLVYFQGLGLHCACGTFLQESPSRCSALAAESNQGHLSFEESLLPKIKRPPWGQTLSNDQQSLSPLPPTFFQQNSKEHPSFRAPLEWGLCWEWTTIYLCLILVPACPNKDFSTQLLAHKSPNDSMLWKTWSVTVLSPETCKAKICESVANSWTLKKVGGQAQWAEMERKCGFTRGLKFSR